MNPGNQVVVKLSSPTDIVGAVPYLVGFVPHESVVVVCLGGPRKRVRLTMRHDLVAAADEVGLADALVRGARRVGAARFIVIVYTEDGDEAGALPRSALVRVLRDRLGGDVVEGLLVRRDRWWSYLCRSACCPAEGTALPTSPEGAVAMVAAEISARGRSVLPDRGALEASVRPATDRRDDERSRAADLAAAAQEYRQECLRDGTDGAAQTTVALLHRAVARWETGSRELAPREAARILVGLVDRRARDGAATLELVQRPEQVGEDRPGSCEGLGQGRRLRPVDPAAYVALLTALCQRADADAAAPVCTVLALVAYQAGDGALANVAVDRALETDPDYALALMLRDGLAAQVRPEAVREMGRLVRAELRGGGRPADRGSAGRRSRRARRL